MIRDVSRRAAEFISRIASEIVNSDLEEKREENKGMNVNSFEDFSMIRSIGRG